jgi:hypothetical protein
MKFFRLSSLFPIALSVSTAFAADYGSAPSIVLESACTDVGALNRIVHRFAWAERTQWHRGFVIERISNPRPSGHSFAEPGQVVRDYCVGDSVMSNGMLFTVYYAIEHGLGFVGLGSNVDFCVLGLDPWHIYDGDCRTVR